jgi:hypothetical protein
MGKIEDLGSEPGEDRRKYGPSTVTHGDSSECGTPRDYWELNKETKEKYCPNCKKLENRVKKCLRCSKDFNPTCRASHCCVRCFQMNLKNREITNFNVR